MRDNLERDILPVHRDRPNFRRSYATQIRVLAVSLLLFFFCGCAQIRGIPSHGGGKRFDEEQRSVVASIRRTIADMDLTQLKGKRTSLELHSLFTSGSGNTTWPGLQSINLSGNIATREFESLRRIPDTISGFRKSILPPVVWEPNHNQKDKDRRESGTVSANYRPVYSYHTANMVTEQDVRYFKAALEMKARHENIPLVRQKAEAHLVVLLDVLGTNRSRRDFMLATDDHLTASCEVTYYALDRKTGQLIFDARQVGSSADYAEKRVALLPKSFVKRSVKSGKPLEYDVLEASEGCDEPKAVTVPLEVNGLPPKGPDAALENEVKRVLLDALRDKARNYLNEGNAQQALEYLRRIQHIDPGYEGLHGMRDELVKQIQKELTPKSDD